ncbi:MAG TPA: sensor domain-containing diguanylate cyclase [Symbiobacteriaceae bacterium]|nr:sensor domain-containing diguanylate cyclase [Symbiobacteriaceae bacterium]
MPSLRMWFSGARLTRLVAAAIVANLLGGLYHVLTADGPVWKVDRISFVTQGVSAIWISGLIYYGPRIAKYVGVGERVRDFLTAAALGLLGLFVQGTLRTSVRPEVFEKAWIPFIYLNPWPIWSAICMAFLSMGLWAVAVEFHRLRYERDNLQSVLKFSESVSLMGKDEVLRETVNAVRRLTSADACLLFLLDPKADLLRVAAHYHDDAVYSPEYIDEIINFPCPRGHGLTGRVMETGELYLSKDVSKEAGVRWLPTQPPQSKTALFLPMKVQGRLIGVLSVSKLGVDQLSPAQVTVSAILANHAAVALDAGNLYHEVLKASRTDPLTGLGNARAFREALEQAVRLRVEFALLMVDADCLKQVNDTFGHQAGDELLIGLSERLRAATEGKGQAYRYAGDEFMVLLPGADRAGACATAERVRVGLAEMYMVSRVGSVHTTVSIGVAGYPSDGADAETVMRAADKAMYSAKAGGKNRVHTAS